jgi:hypothetical protein
MERSQVQLKMLIPQAKMLGPQAKNSHTICQTILEYYNLRPKCLNFDIVLRWNFLA